MIIIIIISIVMITHIHVSRLVAGVPVLEPQPRTVHLHVAVGQDELLV